MYFLLDVIWSSVKSIARNDSSTKRPVMYVEWDVKLYTLTHLLIQIQMLTNCPGALTKCQNAV